MLGCLIEEGKGDQVVGVSNQLVGLVAELAEQRQAVKAPLYIVSRRVPDPCEASLMKVDAPSAESPRSRRQPTVLLSGANVRRRSDR